MIMPNMISVIIPVYNGEKFILGCLASIVENVDGDLEIIAVNDGSTDGTLKLLQEYQCADDRLIIIDQENQGVSCARNSGLKKANGEYFMFVDGDDTLEKNWYGLVQESITETDADAYFFNFRRIFPNGRRTTEAGVLSGVYNGDNYTELISAVLAVNYFSVCFKVFSMKLLTDMGLSFQEGMMMGEDAQFIIRFLSGAKKVYVSDEAIYNYFQNENSAVSTYREDYLYDYETVFLELSGLAQRFGLDMERFEPLYVFYRQMICKAIYNEKEKGMSDRELAAKISGLTVYKRICRHRFHSGRERIIQILLRLHLYEIMALIAGRKQNE